MQPTTSQRAYDHIRQKLVTGQLVPGTRLVNRTLAEEIGSSAIPVREALSRLASEGLVSYIPGAGAYVREPDRAELAQLYGLREAIETYAAQEAARLATEDELHELRTCCREFHTISRELQSSGQPHATAEQMQRWVDCDARYHDILMTAARNPWLTKVVTDFRLVSQIFARQRSEPALLTLSVAADTWRSHHRLVDALARHDEEQARHWMSLQLRHGRRQVLDYLDRQQRSPAHKGPAS